MSGPSTYVPKSAIGRWFESRLPLGGLVHSSFIAYPVPRNLNYMWTFGAILSFMLVAQIVTGVVLAMHFIPSSTQAFASVENIMRNVNYGWLIRYLHSNGASLFFFACYIHMARGLYYGSFKPPRELLWIIGVIIYVLMMATAFFGYVLPWGGMSFAGATVITNLTSAIPLVGNSIAHWLWGGFAVGGPTLTRFFALHYLVPFIIAAFVGLHVWALHVAGQNNPDGIEVKDPQRDTVAFTPYATIKDVVGLSVFLILYCLARVLHSQLSARRGQFDSRQSAGDARACRAGMVFAAVLRHAARHPEQALGRDHLVGGDRRAGVHSLARPLAGQVGEVPPVLSLFLLDLYRDLHWPRLPRLAGADRGAGDHRAHPDVRLFRVLSHHHAYSQLYGEDEADPHLDRRCGADEDENRGGCG